MKIVKINIDKNLATEKAVKYLASSLKTEFEVKNKLQKLGCDSNMIGEIIAHLKEISYIDDKNYVLAYKRQCIKMPKYSIYEIISKLKQKGIHSELLEELRYELEESEYEKGIVEKIKEKKLALGEDIMKINNYLYRRGFKNI